MLEERKKQEMLGFGRNLRLLNAVIMNKSLQFEKQSLAKIEEAIKYIEG
ncbi:hypothetical protein [Borrelia hermsii]|nr:hypothetical protein [Borrelia hermsii]AHH14656.1 hypothetical protein BHW_0900034 [Borrelia hermsii MTW]